MNIPVYEQILRAPDGRERRQLALVPNEQVRQVYIAAARKRGLAIELREINDNNNENEYET